MAGPNDWNALEKLPASWLSKESATPISSYYSLLHRRDEVGIYRQQQKILQRLVGFAEAGRSSDVDRERSPFEHARNLSTDRKPRKGYDGKTSFHNSVVMDAYTTRAGIDSIPMLVPAWRCLLGMPAAPDSIEERMIC